MQQYKDVPQTKDLDKIASAVSSLGGYIGSEILNNNQTKDKDEKKNRRRQGRYKVK
jgi:hypothetical protein